MSIVLITIKLSLSGDESRIVLLIVRANEYEFFGVNSCGCSRDGTTNYFGNYEARREDN